MEQSTIAIIIFAATIFLYVTELVPLGMTAVASCLLMAIAGIIPFANAFAGFGSDIVMMVIGMIVVGEALFETGLAQLMGIAIVRVVGNSERLFLAVIILATASLSAFVSNTATVAMFLPMIAAAAARSGGKIAKKNTYMATGFAAVAGGACTLVGSTPQLAAQGILSQTPGCRPLGFFELAYGGIPLVVFILFYYLTFGYYLQKRLFNFQEIAGDEPVAGGGEEKRSPVKMAVSGLVMAGCVIGFVKQVWSVGTIAMAAAVVLVMTGCITEKKVYQSIHWTSIAILGGALGFSKGLDVSGAGKLIAETAIGLLGASASPRLVFAIYVLVALMLANFMSTTAITAMLSPIAIYTAQGMGFDPIPAVIGIILGTSMGFASPVGTMPITMTLAGGYRFTDYTKVGGLLSILLYFWIIIIVPLLMGF
ncbi:MAG: SLC13 family permease [Peptococcaceae bacterium]|jgi:anion transporter|nr:SLC13 family permease [Peptococcaceae bacterium]MDH7526231.1 SLC13 family permease [Peptococcaceae bacterium]